MEHGAWKARSNWPIDANGRMSRCEDVAGMPGETVCLARRPFPCAEAAHMVIDGEVMDSMGLVALLPLARLWGELA
jgi:hypothetical protein